MKRINPIYLKEIRIGVRTKKTGAILFLYNGIIALFGLFVFYVMFDAGIRYSGLIDYSSILGIYALIAASEFALVLFTIPGLTSGSISGEREKQTLDILLTTSLSPMQVILGKLASSISVMILLAFSSLPILGLIFSIGGVTIRNFLEFLILIIVTAIFIGSIGIFFSTLYKRTTAATVSSYGILLFLVIGTFITVWAIKLLDQVRLLNQVELDNVYYFSDIGNWVLLFLINPAITCFSMLQEQIGAGYDIGRFLNDYGTIPDLIINNWFLISLLVQLLISAILIIWSAHLLDPLRKSSIIKRKTHNK